VAADQEHGYKLTMFSHAAMMKCTCSGIMQQRYSAYIRTTAFPAPLPCCCPVYLLANLLV
jgi:hypothetical protein